MQKNARTKYQPKFHPRLTSGAVWFVSGHFVLRTSIVLFYKSATPTKTKEYSIKSFPTFTLGHSAQCAYLIFVIFFTQAKFLENKIYTEKTRKLRQNTQ